MASQVWKLRTDLLVLILGGRKGLEEYGKLVTFGHPRLSRSITR